LSISRVHQSELALQIPLSVVDQLLPRPQLSSLVALGARLEFWD